MRKPGYPALFLIGALAVGGVLRFVGLGWGLPAQLHPDEWVIVSGALNMDYRRSFEPAYFMRPDHVEIQLSYLAYKAYSLLVAHEPMKIAHAANPGVFLLISRFITTLFGIGMIVLAWFIGKRIAPAVGAIAAVLIALFPPYVLHSHFATPDIPLTAMLMVVTLAGMHYLAKPGYLSLLVAALATSTAIAIKYPGLIAALMIAIVVIVAAVRDRRPLRIVAHGATAVVGVIVFLFMISPVLFTNVDAVFAAIDNEARVVHPGHDGLGWAGNLGFYSSEFLLSAGIITTACFVLGIIFAVRKRLIAAIPLALGLVYWLVLSAVPLHWDRWGLPMFVAPLLLASVGAYYFYGLARERGWLGSRLRPAAIAVTVVIAASLLVTSAAASVRLTAPDTRLEAQPKFAELGITAENAAFEGFSPLLPSAPGVFWDRFAVRDDGTFGLVNPKRVWVVTSSCMAERFYSSPKYVDEQEIYRQIAETFPREFEVVPVPEVDRSPVLPVTAVRAIQTLVAFAQGGSGGCTITVYSAG